MTGVFPAQRASNAEKVSICWRRHILEPKIVLKQFACVASVTEWISDLGQVLLTWFNFNLSMDK